MYFKIKFWGFLRKYSPKLNLLLFLCLNVKFDQGIMVQFPAGATFFFLKTSSPALRPTQPSGQCVLRHFTQGGHVAGA